MPDNLMKARIVNYRSLVFWGLGVYLMIRFLDAIAATLLFFMLAIVLAIALDGPISWLQTKGISRGFSVAITALLLVLTIGFTIYFGAPTLVDQARDTFNHIPEYTTSLQHRAEIYTKNNPYLHKQIAGVNFQQRLTELGQSSLPRIGRFSLDVLSAIVALLLLVAVTFYTVADPAPLIRGALRALPESKRTDGMRIYRRIVSHIQAWAKSTFWLMLIVGLLSGLGLWLLKVPSPLLFGILAGLGEAIPVVGPIISCIPPFLVVLSSDPVKAVWVVILFIIIQQIEGNILVPRIMASAMKLHPVLVLFFVVALGTLTGPIGLLLAIPLLAIAKILFEELYLRRIGSQRVFEANDPGSTISTPKNSPEDKSPVDPAHLETK